jgi:hypothetical protein
MPEELPKKRKLLVTARKTPENAKGGQLETLPGTNLK